MFIIIIIIITLISFIVYIHNYYGGGARAYETAGCAGDELSVLNSVNVIDIHEAK